MATISATRPLAGFKILDLTRFLPGPLAAQFLADLGADVVKIETPPVGDVTRLMDPKVGFLASNRNKRSLLLDLASEEGRTVAASIAAQCDAVIEVSRPGAMKAIGLDYEALSRLKPDIVYCSVSAFGQAGPYRDVPAHGLNIDALAGMLPVAEAADGSSFIPPDHIYLGSLFVAQTAAMGICAALLRRQMTGEGCYIDAACLDCAVGGDPVVSAGTLSGVPMIDGFGSRATPKYAPYRTKDGRHLMACVIERKFWVRFCDLIGKPDLATAFDPADGAGEGDVWGRGASTIYDEVAHVIAGRTLADWEEVFAPAGLPVTPILTRAEALSGENARERGLVLKAPGRDGTSHSMPAFGLTFDGLRPDLVRPAPELGEHSEELLLGFGLTRADVDRLRREGIIA